MNINCVWVLIVWKILIDGSTGIRVVNLFPNGTYPNSFSTLPGEKFAEITICAIGTNVLSTLPGNRYDRMSGTSMAAPFVTGVALLVKAFPKLSREEIRRCILDRAIPIVMDENHEPHLITNPEDLKKYSPETDQVLSAFLWCGIAECQGGH